MQISTPTKKTCRNTESGYGLLMVVFLVATSIILSAAVVPDLLTQGRREREQEMIWRGGQYERAIRLYFTKFQRYPTKVDDLVKQTNGVRFLRKAYTDPMNKDDGSWRFIYVGPNGQLIGSLHSTSLLQSMMTQPNGPGGTTTAAPGSLSPSTGMSGGSGPGQGAAAFGGPGGLSSQQTGQPGQQPGQLGSGASTGNPLESQAQPLMGDVIGGNIIGVGSKIKESSLMVYQGEDTYQKWEFIWNPNLQIAIPGQGATGSPVAPPQGQPAAPTQPGQGLQNQPGGQGTPSGVPSTDPNAPPAQGAPTQ